MTQFSEELAASLLTDKQPEAPVRFTALATEDSSGNVLRTLIVIDDLPADIYDFESDSALAAAITRLGSETSGPYLLDLSGVTRKGDAAEFLSAIIKLHKESVAHGHGPLNICGENNPIEPVLRRMQLDKLFNILASRKEAVAVLGFEQATLDFDQSAKLHELASEAAKEVLARHSIGFDYGLRSSAPLPESAVQIVKNGCSCVITIDALNVAESSEDSELVISKILEEATQYSQMTIDLAKVRNIGADVIGALLSARDILAGNLVVTGVNEMLKAKLAQMRILDLLTGNGPSARAA